MDEEELFGLLEKNKDLNFVDRILNRNKYPYMDLGDGNYATHKMAWGEADGKYFVYPTIVYDKEKKTLNELNPKSAFDYAVKNKEYLEFDKPEIADWVSKNYKLAWSARKAKGIK